MTQTSLDHAQIMCVDTWITLVWRSDKQHYYSIRSTQNKINGFNYFIKSSQYGITIQLYVYNKWTMIIPVAIMFNVQGRGEKNLHSHCLVGWSTLTTITKTCDAMK